VSGITASTPGEPRSKRCRRSTRFPDAATVSRPDAGPASDRRGHPPGPGPGHAASCAKLGTATETISSRRNSLARCIAFRGSVLTRSPPGRWIFEGAAISHLIPAAVNARDDPTDSGHEKLPGDGHEAARWRT